MNYFTVFFNKNQNIVMFECIYNRDLWRNLSILKPKWNKFVKTNGQTLLNH